MVASESGGQLIVTRQILSPHGLSECTLQLPSEQSLVAISLDGRPALVRPREESKWDVALTSRQLPQSLEIVSRRAATHILGSTAQLQRPTLIADAKPIAVEVSLWSFACPLTSSKRLIAGADEVNAVDQSALRFDRLVSIAEAAKTSAAQLPPPDGYNWFQSWATLLSQVRNQSQQTIALPHLERAESQVSHPAADQISQAAQRSDKWLEDCRQSLTGSKSQNTSLAIYDSSMALLLDAPGAGEWTYYVAEGGNNRLDLQLQRVEPTTAQIQLIGLLLIVSLLSASIWLMRWPVSADFICRWPHAVGVLLGVAYWAWLWPSWLGILIGAVSVWLALRFVWPGRSRRAEGSTVLRSH